MINKDRLIFSRKDRIFFTADTHWGHRNIIRYCQRPFADVDEMNEALITNWNSTIGKDDIVFHLGDFAMGGSAEWCRLLERLNGRIYLILGNHLKWQNLSHSWQSRHEDHREGILSI